MKITLTLIDKLLRLRGGGSIPSSALHGEWVESLLADGVLVSRSHGSRRTLCASSPATLEACLGRIDERLADLSRLRGLLAGTGVSRAEQAAATGNSKLVATRSCPGFPVNSFEPIACVLGGEPVVVAPPEGTFLFIADWQTFRVPADVTIVNVENMENFRRLRQQRRLFAEALPGRRLLFVSRYPQSADLRSWLQTIPNAYVHFGDFDLAGIHIFLTEFRKHLGARASFLIPPDIAQRLQHGSLERYSAQYAKFRNLTTDIPQLQQLIALIHKARRCYDQEGYISNDTTT